MSGVGFPIFSDDLGLRSSEKLERPISGASLLTLPYEAYARLGRGLNPR